MTTFDYLTEGSAVSQVLKFNIFIFRIEDAQLEGDMEELEE
jgi:hypothetical protein